MKRVLLTAHKFFPQHRAGTEVLTLKVAQDLLARGYEVLVVAANPPDLDARRKIDSAINTADTTDYVYEGVPVHIVEEPLRLRQYTFKHEYTHDGIGHHFDAILQKFAPDVVHMFHCQNLSASIIDSTLKRRIPIVFTATDFWFVCPVIQLKRPDGALCQGPSPLALNCLTCYTPMLFPPQIEIEEALARKHPQLSEQCQSLPKPLPALAVAAAAGAYTMSKLPAAVAATMSRPKALKDILNKVNSIMVATKLMRDIFVRNGIDSHLIKHVPFGLDVEPLLPFQNKERCDILRIGFIGTIFEHKGLDLLIEAFQLLPAGAQAQLDIYGDLNQFPQYGQKMLDLAARPYANSKNIRFAGTFPNSQLGPVLQKLDVLVVPSRWYENTPLVIQSALCTKTPVICTDLGGMSEIIKDNVNGLLFPLNDSKSLCRQLTRLIEEPQLLPRLIKNIAPERSIAQMVDNIEETYAAL